MKKNFLEKLLDLIYDYIDYIVMIVIIILVVGVIAWRLDLIFTDNGTSSQPPIEEVEDETNEQLDDEEPKVPEDTDDPNEETEDPESENPEGDMGMEVEIEIPSGTMPTGIGRILLENNLIQDSTEFLSAVQSQNLETGLKAGVYIIPSGSDINEILQILTN